MEICDVSDIELLAFSLTHQPYGDDTLGAHGEHFFGIEKEPLAFLSKCDLIVRPID